MSNRNSTTIAITKKKAFPAYPIHYSLFESCSEVVCFMKKRVSSIKLHYSQIVNGFNLYLVQLAVCWHFITSVSTRTAMVTGKLESEFRTAFLEWLLFVAAVAIRQHKLSMLYSSATTESL